MIEPTQADIGREVVYTGFGTKEYGRITSFTEKFVFVRYHLKVESNGEKRPRFGDTSEATKREDLDWCL